MALQMIRPTKHQRSGVYRLRLAIPKRLQATSERLYCRLAEFIESLGTKDAKRLAPEAEIRLGGRLAVVEADHPGAPLTLTDRQCLALAGEWYRNKVMAAGDSPGSTHVCSLGRSALWDRVERDPNASSTRDPCLTTSAEQERVLM